MPRQPHSPRETRFSQRLNRLFETHLAPTTPPRLWTLTEVAEKTGLTVGYLSKARLGAIDYPGKDKLRPLADFFGVHVDYFTQEREDAADAALVTPDMLATLSRSDVAALLTRAGKMGPEELRLLSDLMGYLEKRLQGSRRMAITDPEHVAVAVAEYLIKGEAGRVEPEHIIDKGNRALRSSAAENLSGLPPEIEAAYKAALSVKGIESNAFGILVGRLLEKVCRDRGAQGRALPEQMRNLSVKGEIPDHLADLAQQIWQLRNIGNHAGAGELSSADVPLLNDLCRAILEYVYVAPQTIVQVRARLDASADMTHGSDPSLPPCEGAAAGRAIS